MKAARLVVALALVAYGVFGMPTVRIPSLPLPSVAVKEPQSQMKTLVRPVVKVVSKMNAVDRLWLQNIYSNAARVVESDGVLNPPVVTTTAGLREIHVAILKFIWRGLADNDAGEYAGLKEAIESVFNETMGDSQRALTPELRNKAVEMFEAISWAGLGKDG